MKNKSTEGIIPKKKKSTDSRGTRAHRQCARGQQRKQNYKARKLQLSSKSAKELKVKTPEAFVHSDKVWKNSSFKS